MNIVLKNLLEKTVSKRRGPKKQRIFLMDCLRDYGYLLSPQSSQSSQSSESSESSESDSDNELSINIYDDPFQLSYQQQQHIL